MYIKRDMEPLVKTLSAEYPAILITGPRQVGKTTMLQKLMEGTNRSYVIGIIFIYLPFDGCHGMPALGTFDFPCQPAGFIADCISNLSVFFKLSLAFEP